MMIFMLIFVENCLKYYTIYDFFVWFGTGSNSADINRFRSHTGNKFQLEILWGMSSCKIILKGINFMKTINVTEILQMSNYSYVIFCYFLYCYMKYIFFSELFIFNIMFICLLYIYLFDCSGIVPFVAKPLKGRFIIFSHQFLQVILGQVDDCPAGLCNWHFLISNEQ